MGKFSSAVSLVAAIVGCALLPSCGGGSPTTVTSEILPTGVSISPSPVVSLEVGNTQTFTAGPTGHTFSFQSDNPAVLTIAGNGNACAGSWNSLSNPQICTPGQPGMATVTASTLGVASSGVTVYVHAPITSITVSKVPGQTPTISNSCISKGAVHGPESWLFQANAFNGTTDITASVGPFSWQQINPGSSDIVNLGTPGNGTQGCLLSPGGQCLNRQTATANVPGISQIFATTSGFSSHPIPIETCRVQSITVAAAGNPSSTTSFLVTSGASTTLNATVVDVAGQGQTITGVPMTWSASNPISAKPASATTAASNNAAYGSTNPISTPAEGEGTVTVSCTPPDCNGGIVPSLPIYAQAAFSFNVQPTSTPATTTPSVFATTMACTDPFRNPSLANCTPTVVPITKASSTAMFTAGAPVPLEASPNSFVYDNAGSFAYLGVDTSRFSQQGLMVFSGSTPTNATSVSGTVLAVSPDQNSVILANTVDSPNQVFICSSCSGTSRTITKLLISGATSAAFSPDSLKAYILAANNIYVYSKVDPLETIPLAPGTRASDVVFHPQGNFAYVAGPSPGITPYRSCDNSQIAGANVATANPVLMLRALGDGSTLLALDPPDITIISTTLHPVPPVLCTGTITSTSTSFNLGQGSFIPTQFIVAPNGLAAYILGETSLGPQPARLPFVIVFNLATETPSLISLSNSATPLNAAISPDSSLLFVGADDGTVHVIETASRADTQQVTFIFPDNALCFGPGTPATQVPLSQVRILAAAGNGSNTTYSYVLVSGPALKVGQSITISQMANGGNNGTFTIAALSTDAAGNPTFTVSNSNGVSAAGQSGSGVVPISCNPDLVAVKP